MSRPESISELQRDIAQLDQPVKSSDFIDYNPKNNELTSREQAYIAFVAIFGICFLVGLGLITFAYIQSNNNKNQIAQYQKLLENRTFELVCWKTANATNPCNTAIDPAIKLFNWQLDNYFSTLGSNYPCLEIQNRITLNTPTPMEISMNDANALFGLGPMVFPNTINSVNPSVNTGPTWLQSQIRLTPNTHLKMAPGKNLFVAPNNLYGIQIQVVNFNDNIVGVESLDYCQSNSPSSPGSDAESILNASPLFMYYNTFTTQLNNTIPSFTVCTCLMNKDTNLWTSFCIPGTDFILS